jgi:hypothetical protein
VGNPEVAVANARDEMTDDRLGFLGPARRVVRASPQSSSHRHPRQSRRYIPGIDTRRKRRRPIPAAIAISATILPNCCSTPARFAHGLAQEQTAHFDRSVAADIAHEASARTVPGTRIARPSNAPSGVAGMGRAHQHHEHIRAAGTNRLRTWR